MKINSLVFLPLGDAAITIEFGTGISRSISRSVMAAAKAIINAEIDGVRDVVPAFRSLTIHLDPAAISQAGLIETIGGIEISNEDTAVSPRTVTIPVLYGRENGPDIEDVARETGLSPVEVANRHAATSYHAYMLGFLPGFAYLGDLPDELRLPRLVTPRTRVPAGSVAIADQMTAVYPAPSPGGWRLIGQTPLRLFDAAALPASVLAAGDAVTFRRIDDAEFHRISRAVEQGKYTLEIA